jgi:hypothetical protein
MKKRPLIPRDQKDERVELARSLKIIRKGVDQINAGQGRPMKEFLEELAAEHGIDLHS